MNFPSEKGDWKKFEKNNVTIALNVLYVKKEKICPAYVLKCFKASCYFIDSKWRRTQTIKDLSYAN